MEENLNKVLHRAINISKRTPCDIPTSFFKLGLEFGSLSKEFYNKFTFKGDINSIQKETVDTLLACVLLLQKTGISLEKSIELVDRQIDEWEGSLDIK